MLIKKKKKNYDVLLKWCFCVGSCKKIDWYVIGYSQNARFVMHKRQVFNLSWCAFMWMGDKKMVAYKVICRILVIYGNLELQNVRSVSVY